MLNVLLQIKIRYIQCECKGVEIKDNRTQREFRLICKKTEVREVIENKKKKKVTVVVWDTSCIYGGDPHSCKEYNKKQEKFYQGLLNVMSDDFCAAVLKKGECKDVTYKSNTICKDIKYTFNK